MEADSWTDHGSTGVASTSSKTYNAIDPNLIDVGGTYYLNFGSFWDDIYQVPMNSAATASSSSSYNIAYDPSGDHAVEGSYMYQYGDYYYLFYSAGICCGYDTSMPAAGQEYKIKVCRSTSVSGGFVSVYTDPSLGPVLYYHYINTDIGYADDQKQFGWNQIDFSTGWPVV
ncbi:arabinan endo-1-5-alpha-L-arabinosidase A [Penicillium lagena]|uniref:arabinan endo-1-5-alpha-L-arabinosidase A n=1 Tax=Penicillium lagena TaxID=94218 RepID=UPI0025409BEE|nr:arabinan endo-1-5-alpha-L-arabinosidase A [Penicillium lagena]KAJ5626241.1 arabinan endo-1-5-alpha-L-arabinosidase A [Penicillium lagena]